MKAETKHTPGPWDGFGVHGHPLEIRSRKTGQTLATIHSSFADSRLIAAAPEMYSLLDLADELDAYADSDHDARLALEKIGNAARALIAKIKQS